MNHHTVLFVDDEVNILRALQRLLRSEPVTLLTASSPEQALALVETEDIQVVVTDQRMPEMTGVDQANVIDPCVRNVVEGHAMLPSDRKYWFYDEEAFERGTLKPKHVLHNECTWVWNSIMVNWDGSVVPCCRDPHGHHVLGNAFETPLREIWNAKPATDFRRQIASNQQGVDICELCSGFGVPQLMPEAPVDFKIGRLSLDSTPIDFDYDPVTGAELPGVPSADRGKAATAARL